MSFPAYESFAHEPDLTVTRWRVYMTLKPPFLGFIVPRYVRITLLTEALKFQGRRRAAATREDVAAAVDWLTARGYLREHSRDARGVRELTIEFVRREVEAMEVAVEPSRSRSA